MIGFVQSHDMSGRGNVVPAGSFTFGATVVLPLSRWHFLQDFGATFALVLLFLTSSGNAALAAEPSVSPIGRPVRIVTLSFPAGRKRNEVAQLVEREASQGTDLIVLPETWTGYDPEPLGGPTTTTMAELAKKHHTYIVSPIYRREGNDNYNSAIVLDREGKVVCVYDKVFPFPPEYQEHKNLSGLKCGREAKVCQTDFGKIGLAICFDVNFPDLWQQMADQGAELVIWPSAYPGRLSLQSHAILHHYYIVSATHNAHEATNSPVYDITGEPILDPSISDKKTGDIAVARLTLDLDRTLFGLDYGYMAKARQLMKEHPNELSIEKTMEHEGWFVMKAIAPRASVRELARDFGLLSLRDSLRRDRQELARRRGSDFGSTTLSPDPKK